MKCYKLYRTCPAAALKLRATEPSGAAAYRIEPEE